MTTVVPESFHQENRRLWAAAEASKRWVLANLARWNWFLDRDDGPRPTFHMLAEVTRDGPATVMMGHADGVLTINVVEADPVTRIARGNDLGEKLRTLAGHFRHELAHFLFERLATRPDFLDEFRSLFGDERCDYADALKRHYKYGPPDGWEQFFVSSYASCHPHEDWAESLAHLLHLTDIVDSCVNMNLRSPNLPAGYDAYGETDPVRLVSIGVEIGIAMNHANRSMGLHDIYPFILTPETRAKLYFAHTWLRAMV